MDVLYEDERIIVVDKPHFLATMPRGMWYRQTALIRLRERLQLVARVLRFTDPITGEKREFVSRVPLKI